MNEKSGKTTEVEIITGTGIRPGSYLQIHFITLRQIHNDTTENGIAITSISQSDTASHEICPILLATTVEICIELVGAVMRSDEFTIVIVVDIINVAAADVGDDPVELDDFIVRKWSIVR